MKAHLILKNAEVITVDEQFSIKEAVAVIENKIVAVGTNEEIEKWVGDNTTVIDTQGKTVLPGFIDAHLHIYNHALTKVSINLKSCRTIEDTLFLLKEKVDATEPGKWIRGWGYNDNNVKEGRLPNRYELDEISTEHPIYIQRSCGHVITANSYALKLAGIDESTEDPAGGEIERNNGVPTGILKESARMLVADQDFYTDEEIYTGLKLAAEDYIESGITSIHDLGGKSQNHLMYLQNIAKDDAFKLRMYLTIVSFDNSSDAIDKTLAASILTGLGNEKIKIGPSKLFLDGSITGQTAAMSEGYISNPNNKGILYMNQDQVNSIMERPHLAGCQITAHAIGDSAVDMMVSCIEHVLSLANRENHRHRIEHASVCTPELLERMKKLDIIIVTNPAFFYDFGDEYVKNIGDRAHMMFPISSYLANGIKVAAGSDDPVTDYHPLLGIQEIVTRKTKNGTVIGETECVPIEDAIKIFTINGAYASFEEHIKGSIEVGKLADFVVLEESILACSTDTIKDLSIDMTIIDGEIVYKKKSEELVSF